MWILGSPAGEFVPDPSMCGYEMIPGVQYLEAFTSDGLPIEVLTTTAPDARALMDLFDWVICQHYYSRDEGFVSFGLLPRPGARLELNPKTPGPHHTPAKTLARGFRFAHRYRMFCPTEDVSQSLRIAHDASLTQ